MSLVSHSVIHSASSVALHKQRRVRGLGRGPRSKNSQQSPIKHQQLRILQCNVNGLCSSTAKLKLDLLLELADLNNVQIIALQESKLKSHHQLKAKVYNIFRSDRKSGQAGGGLVFLVRHIHYKSLVLPQHNDSNLEVQGIEFPWKGKTIKLLNSYHPPNSSNLPDYMMEWSDDNTLFLGDLNAKHTNWGCSSSNLRGNTLLNLIDDKGFMILNDGSPTHSSHSYATSEALDISFVSPDIYPHCRWTVLNNIGSDHLPILIEVKLRQQSDLERRRFWNFKKADWRKFGKLSDIGVDSISLSNDVNSSWKMFTSTILKAARKSIPRGFIKKFNPGLSHSSVSLKHLLDKRTVLTRNFQPGDSTARAELNKTDALIKREYALSKRKRWNELCSILDARTNDSKLWKLVKNLDKQQPQIESCNTILAHDGSIPRGHKEVADILGLYYQNISKLTFSVHDKAIERKARNLAHSCRSMSNGDPLFFKCFSIHELDLAISESNLSKSPGPDGIHGQMIKHLGEQAKKRLLEIVNLSWRKGRLPGGWKRATIIPIRKPGKIANSPESFRPIDLTSIPCKIMEKMILTRINFHLATNNLLPREQYAFRKGHSTTDQALFLSQRIRDAQNAKPTKHTAAVFLDLSKAFDRVWRNLLLCKLFDNFGIRGRTFSWIADFLRDRHFSVKYGEAFSRSFRINQGVPQGSVLSPVLFNLFMAGIENTVIQPCEFGMFADDIAIWCSNSDVSVIESALNETLKNVWNFSIDHKLTFNISKSNVSFFTTNKHLYSLRPKIFLNEQLLSFERHPKYLGFVLDQEITSNKHIQHLVDKSRKRLNLLKFISGRDWGANAKTLRTTYLALIRPILEYGYPVYFCASSTNLHKLERVQLCAARIITGLKNSCPNEIALYEADLPPLSHIRNSNLVKYFNKLKSYSMQNRTSEYLCKWRNNRRLKRHSPFSLAEDMNIISNSIEPSSLMPRICPVEGLPNVFFHTDLGTYTNKNQQLPDYLRVLALEVVSNIPNNAIKIFTDGSKNDLGQTGSGVLIDNHSLELSRRNPDHCSVFRSELIAISVGLDTILSDTGSEIIWILSDSRSAIQHLQTWHQVSDRVSLQILDKLKYLTPTRVVHFQWIPSHVGVPGNETADLLAKRGSTEALTCPDTLTYHEISSIWNNKCKIWPTPPAHHWYCRKRPGCILELEGCRSDITAISRLFSGHLRGLTFISGHKVFPTCNKCHLEPASPEHVLDCLGLSLEDLVSSPLLVIDFARIHGLMDQI